MPHFKRFLLHGSIGIVLLAGLLFTFPIGTSSAAFAHTQSCNSVATWDWSNNCTIYEGNISSFVLAIQETIDDTHTYDGCYTYPDGHYGPNTFAAIECYQRDRHLRVDGIVGPQTWHALQSELLESYYDGRFAYFGTGTVAVIFEEDQSSGVWWVWDDYTGRNCQMGLGAPC